MVPPRRVSGRSSVVRGRLEGVRSIGKKVKSLANVYRKHPSLPEPWILPFPHLSPASYHLPVTTYHILSIFLFNNIPAFNA